MPEKDRPLVIFLKREPNALISRISNIYLTMLKNLRISEVNHLQNTIMIKKA
jgi:hypothetical protein